MPINPGQPVLPGDVTETRDAAEGVEAGDAVVPDGEGGMDLITDGDEFGGVARHDGDNDGRGNAMILTGTVVAAVEDDVSEGDRLGAPGDLDDDGALVVEAGGPVLALSDEGGEWHVAGVGSYDVPDGYAVVTY